LQLKDRTMPRKSLQAGSTLIEVLVSILLMTFTLVGIVGLLSVSTRLQLGVEARSNINSLLNDFGNRIRANLDPTDLVKRSTWTAHYTSLGIASKNWAAQQSTDPTSTDCTAKPCSRAERAEFDYAEVRRRMGQTMAQPALQLTVADANSGSLQATFIWFDKDYTLTGSSELATSPICSSSDSALQAQTCCPTAAGTASTPGLRCLNLVFVP
jgi:type IV pilus assembly protein PilV